MFDFGYPAMYFGGGGFCDVVSGCRFLKSQTKCNCAAIIAVAEKIPDNIMEEDPKLLMWYEQTATRMGGE